jgi:hypothetical protein
MAVLLASATPGASVECHHTPPQIPTVCEEAPAVWLRRLMVPWVVRQA